MTDLPPEVRERAFDAGVRAYQDAVNHVPEWDRVSRLRRAVDAVAAVVAPEIARPLQAQLEMYKMAHEGLSVTNLQLRARITELEAENERLRRTSIVDGGFTGPGIKVEFDDE